MRAIAAVDMENAIGVSGRMPWHLSGDLRRFRQLTMGGTVVMGRKTFESLGLRPLPGRRNVVMSRTMAEGPGYEVVRRMEELAKLPDDAWVIGGGEVYRALWERIDELHLTVVKTIVKGADAWFPGCTRWGEWEMISRSEEMEERGMRYYYVDYRRVFQGLGIRD